MSIRISKPQKRQLLRSLGSQIQACLKKRSGYDFVNGLAAMLVEIGVLTEAQCKHLWTVLCHKQANPFWRYRTHGCADHLGSDY